MINKISILLILLLAGPVWAAQPAELHGVVLDDHLAGIAGAVVVVKSGDQVIAQEETGPRGTFTVSLQTGKYRVEVAAAGFEREIHTVNLIPMLASLSFSMKPLGGATDAIQDMADDDQEMEQYLRGLMEPASNATIAGDDFVLGLLTADSESTTQLFPIRGTVFDNERMLVIGAVVVVKSGNRIVAEAQSGIDGTFNIPLKAGLYTVEVTVSGLEIAVQTVTLTPDLAPLSFPLKVH